MDVLSYMPISAIYLTAIDYNNAPKPIFAGILGSTFMFFRTCGFDIQTSCIFTVLFVEIMVRVLFFAWIIILR
jgi:hypothetical protein